MFMVWIKSESKLRQFMNELNQKLQSIKFDFKFSKEKIKSFWVHYCTSTAATDSRPSSTRNQLTVKII